MTSDVVEVLTRSQAAILRQVHRALLVGGEEPVRTALFDDATVLLNEHLAVVEDSVIPAITSDTTARAVLQLIWSAAAVKQSLAESFNVAELRPNELNKAVLHLCGQLYPYLELECTVLIPAIEAELDQTERAVIGADIAVRLQRVDAPERDSPTPGHAADRARALIREAQVVLGSLSPVGIAIKRH